MSEQYCGICRYYTYLTEDDSKGKCLRFPKSEKKIKQDCCGEFKYPGPTKETLLIDLRALIVTNKTRKVCANNGIKTIDDLVVSGVGFTRDLDVKRELIQLLKTLRIEI